MEKTVEEIKVLIRGLVTFLPHEDIVCLAEHAAKVPDGGNIVEIGTADGASAIIMALASKPSVHVYTMDPQDSQKFFNKIKELGLESRVTFLHGKSEDVINQWSGEEIELLFVDGMHNYSAVMFDVSNWGAFVKDGSTILIHDTLFYSDTIGMAARKLIDTGLIEEIETLQEDFDGKFHRAVGMMVAKKLPWTK